MRFSILLASRHRSSILIELLDSLVETTKYPNLIEVLVVIDSDDDTYKVDQITNKYKDINVRFFVRNRTQWMHKDYINWVYKKSSGKYIIVVNDDSKFVSDHWDHNGWEKLEQYVSDKKDGIVYGFNDTMSHPSLCAFPLFSRQAVEVLGFVLPNERKNWGADYDIHEIYNHPSVNRKLLLPEIRIQHVSHHTGMRERDNVSFEIEKAFMTQSNVYIPVHDYVEKLSNYIFGCNFNKDSKILVVYNICGISKRENTDYYISAINSILNQEFTDGFHVVISACCSSQHVKDILVAAFGNSISYNWIEDVLPLNVTFNYTIRKCIERFGNFDSYLYVDSGVNFSPRRDVIQILSDSMRMNDYAMIAAQVDIDSGYDWWEVKIPTDQDYTMPVGKTCNLHCQLFSHQMYESYNDKLMPDIFAHHTSESNFTFLTAAIGKRWGISHKVKLHHETCMDGASSGFITGNLLFSHTKKSIEQICKEGHKFGFGYEEYKKICIHNPDKFKDGIALDGNLYPFLRDNLYLDDDFKYNKINHTFVPAMKSSTITVPSPQISCIMVSHDKPEYVIHSINSVMNQTFLDWELIIYDSGILSDNGFFDYLSDKRIRLILTNETHHMKTTKAMAPWCFNEAFRRKQANGFLITYLCDDDIFYPNAFETFINFYKNNPHVKAMYASQDMAISNNGHTYLDGERRALVKRGSCIGGEKLDCQVDYLQICHQRCIIEELYAKEDEVWPEGRGTEQHADGVFMEKIGRITPFYPIDVKIGQNRRTPVSTYQPVR